MIEIKNVVKRYDDKLVTDNLSFNVNSGEIFGLLGPNGAGKSTLINMITGLKQMNKGQIIVDGHDITKEPIATKKIIGIVPQEIALFKGLNAYDNLQYFGALYGLSGSLLKERIDEVLKIVALEDVGKKLVKNYSGGMMRRLNIAAALMHHPKVLIMDEPTVGVDPQSRNYIFDMILKINKERKTTIIYTSHYMEEVELLCNNILIIDNGKKVAFGTKEELKKMIQDNTVMHVTAQGDVDSLFFDLKDNDKIIKIIKEKDEIKIIAKESFTMNDLLVAIEKSNVTVKNISLDQISLEEVFLTLTGKKLRDEEE